MISVIPTKEEALIALAVMGTPECHPEPEELKDWSGGKTGKTLSRFIACHLAICDECLQDAKDFSDEYSLGNLPLPIDLSDVFDRPYRRGTNSFPGDIDFAFPWEQWDFITELGLHIFIGKKGDDWSAYCPEFDATVEGTSKQDALENLVSYIDELGKDIARYNGPIGGRVAAYKRFIDSNGGPDKLCSQLNRYLPRFF